jgi:hypothetical protein
MAAGACDDSTDPFAPELEAGSAVVAGRVVTTAPAAVAAASSSSTGAGVVVEVVGTAAVDTTDANGAFRLEVAAGDDPLVLRFRTGGLEATLELQGVPAGTILGITVDLSQDGARLGHRDDGDHDDLDGYATLLSVAGDAPTRSMLIEVRDDDDDDDRYEVRVDEEATVFDSDGDLDDFGALLQALEAGRTVEVDVDARRTENGALVAVHLEADLEDDEDSDDSDDDGNDDSDGEGEEEDFEGYATFVEVVGEAPQRTLRLEVAEDDDDTLLVHVLEGVTEIDDDGDYTTFQAILDAARSGRTLDVEGDGSLQDDGSLAAHEIEVDDEGSDDSDDGNDDSDGEGEEEDFEGYATFVEVVGEAPQRTLRLEVAEDDDDILLVHVLEGVTEIDDDGDYTTFQAILDAARSGHTLDVEGDGSLQDDGSLAAHEIEVDDEG